MIAQKSHLALSPAGPSAVDAERKSQAFPDSGNAGSVFLSGLKGGTLLRSIGWLRHAAILALALLALGVPRLITATPLDLLSKSLPPDDPAEDPAANFPGSAYFFDQGLFDRPVPPPSSNRHVLAFEQPQAAPAAALRGLTPLDSYRALNCLTAAVYYEAGNEPEEGQRAVAQVVLNRVRSPLWPHSVCAVVYQGSERTDLRCQFSFSCDGAMARPVGIAAWARARSVAAQALAGRVYAPAGLATFYHSLAVRPGWAASKQPVAVIGAHIFYRNGGVHGTASAFRIAYPGRELTAGPAPRPWTHEPPLETARPDRQPITVAAESPGPGPDEREPALPESTIRPEFRNSGRPRI